MSALVLTHDAQVALVGLWAAVAITAFPFTLEWKRPLYGWKAAHRTQQDPGAVLACLVWPVIPLGVVMLLVAMPLVLVADAAPRRIAEWWNKPWGRA